MLYACVMHTLCCTCMLTRHKQTYAYAPSPTPKSHSGDTGPSALAAVAGKARMRLLVLYPKGRVSPTQVGRIVGVCKWGIDEEILSRAGPVRSVFWTHPSHA